MLRCSGYTYWKAKVLINFTLDRPQILKNDSSGIIIKLVSRGILTSRKDPGSWSIQNNTIREVMLWGGNVFLRADKVENGFIIILYHKTLSWQSPPKVRQSTLAERINHRVRPPQADAGEPKKSSSVKFWPSFFILRACNAVLCIHQAWEKY